MEYLPIHWLFFQSDPGTRLFVDKSIIYVIQFTRCLRGGKALEIRVARQGPEKMSGGGKVVIREQKGSCTVRRLSSQMNKVNNSSSVDMTS